MISIVKTMYFLGPLGLKGTLHNIIYRYTFWGLLAKKEHVRIPSYRLLSVIELLGGARGGCLGWVGKSRYEWTQVKQSGFPRSFGTVTSVLHRYSVSHDPQILEPAWLPSNKKFCGPQNQQTYFLWVALWGHLENIPKNPFDRYLQCFFGVIARP